MQCLEDFIQSQAVERGLDERTVKAYRLDLEHLYIWLQERKTEISDKRAAEEYLDYLLKIRKLRSSTVTRKYRVLCCYLEYLAARGLLPEYRPLLPPAPEGRKHGAGSLLSKPEIDSFFMAINREYERLDSDFRKRICLRDTVMMELLFYYGIEISEMLRLEISDYNEKTGVLLIRGKREKVRSVYLFSKKLRERLGMWLEEHGCFEREEMCKNWLFLSKLGRPLSMKMVISIFDKYRVMAGIEKEATPKDLKKSMAGYAQELLRERCG